ncbi:MAG: primosomal protein N', partial [Rhodoglobus sp.]
VQRAVAASGVEEPDVLGPVDLGPNIVRTILRFDYARGVDVAADLRAEVIRAATSRRRAPGQRGPVEATLRTRLDDVEPFLQS